MFHIIRHKFGPITVSLIVGFIAFVFVFFGFYTPGEGIMGGSGGGAATVNGEPISMAEFRRAYESRMQFYEGLMKGKVDAAAMAKLGLKKSVLDDLVRQKVLVQEATRQGIVVADKEVAKRIAQMPYFQREGRFDKVLYHDALKANGYSAGRFEDMVREEVALGKVSELVRGAIKVSEQEIKDEFLANANQRQVTYVIVTPPPRDPKAAAGKPEQEMAAAKKLAEEVAQAVKVGGSALRNVLSKNKLVQRETDPFSAAQGFISGLGDVKNLKDDAFLQASPLSAGPKIYESYGSYIVAWGLKKFEYSEKDFPAQRDRWYASIRSKKDRQFYDGWVQGLVKRARVKYNDTLLADQ
jgi:parvulin-like peptidyl-prolyl isomerase